MKRLHHAHTRKAPTNSSISSHHMSDENGYVYVVGLGNSDCHKIGMCKNIERRLRELAASNINLRLVIATIVRHPRKSEKNIHHKFKSQKLHREIYHLSQDDLNFIQSYLDERSPAIPEREMQNDVAGS